MTKKDASKKENITPPTKVDSVWDEVMPSREEMNKLSKTSLKLEMQFCQITNNFTNHRISIMGYLYNLRK